MKEQVSLMKPLKSKITRTLESGSSLNCADNSGAKKLKMIGVVSRRSTMTRRATAGVADKINVTVTQGDKEVKGEVFDAIVIRQQKEYRRPEGLRISFEDNAAVLLDGAGLPKGNKIKGAVAKEATVRYSAIGKVARKVV